MLLGNCLDLKSAIEPDVAILKPDTPLESILLHLGQEAETSGVARPPAPYILIGHEPLEAATIGIVTSRDLIRWIAAKKPIASLRVADIMTCPIVSLQATDCQTIFCILSLLRQHRINQLPIFDRPGRFLGIISFMSLCRVLGESEILKQQQVGEMMGFQVVQAHPNTTVRQIAQLLSQPAIESVVIVHPGQQTSDSHYPPGSPLGLITPQKILQAYLAGLDFDRTPAQQIMEQKLPYLQVSESLWSAYQQMQIHQVQQLAVIDLYDRLQGIMTPEHLLKIFEPVALYHMVERLQQQIANLESDHRRTSPPSKIPHPATDLPDPLSDSPATDQVHPLDAILSNDLRWYQYITETLLEGIWVIDQNSRTYYVNERMANMLGYTVEEMLGKSLFEFMDEEGKAIAFRLIDRRRQGIREQHEFKFQQKTGETVWAMLSTNPIYDDAGHYIGGIALLTDITAHKHLNQLAESPP